MADVLGDEMGVGGRMRSIGSKGCCYSNTRGLLPQLEVLQPETTRDTRLGGGTD